MNTEREVREELDRLFPREPNESRFDEWVDLVKQGLTVAAATRIRKWKIEAERNRRFEESDKKPVLKYTELTVNPQPSGITIRGSADIGSMVKRSDVLSSDHAYEK